MFHYLVGKVIDITKNFQSKIVLILELNNIAYEIYISGRFARELDAQKGENVKIFIHFLIRDDQQNFFGFPSAAEKDLFRQLINVSGVGSQSALGLIDTLGLEDLVQAIVTANIKMLVKTPGIGQKTAERVALELKTKLSQWRLEAGVNICNSYAPPPEIVEDLEMTLLALGYSKSEMERAISVLSQDDQLLKNPKVEEWIRMAIAYLSLNN